MILRPYQQATVDYCYNWAQAASAGQFLLVAAPTGVGKSFCELALQEKLGPDTWLITPRVEIARGIIDKKNIPYAGLSSLIDACWSNRISTPIRFRNRLFRGEIERVKFVIYDEAHHASAESWRDTWLGSGMPPCILFTASPFRGTPRSTAAFREMFGEPIWMITLPEAIACGDVSMPEIEIQPLVDDDEITLGINGEFNVASLESATNDRLTDAANLAVDRWYKNDWGRLTVFNLPTTATARRMASELIARKAPAAVITAKTPDAERVAIFTAARLAKLAIVQINVISEGVDLPVRRLIDLAPAVSPVKWLQCFGRATRPLLPGEEPGLYVCTNRNLLRHAYLLDGLVPPCKIADATKAFGGLGKRSAMRVIGLENLGRFKYATIPLLDGNQCQFYTLVDASNGRLREYACLMHPGLDECIWAYRQHTSENGVKTYGTWVRTESPTELKGFVSQFGGAPTEKMTRWFERSAPWHGIDVTNMTLNRKNFGILPFCVNLNLKLARKA